MSFLSPRWSWGLPSELTEFISGLGCDVLGALVALLCYGVARLLHHRLSTLACMIIGVATAEVAAFAYELWWDANGFEWEDVRQRHVGIAFGFAVALTIWWRMTR